MLQKCYKCFEIVTEFYGIVLNIFKRDFMKNRSVLLENIIENHMVLA